jgi:endonuclease YncB( thermonuclease family)
MRTVSLAVVFLTFGALAQAQSITGPARVVAGDTLEVAGQRVRLYGIDAPESKQSCIREGQRWPSGKESTRYLASLVGSGEVTCAGRDKDQYGRIAAVCSVEGTNLNAAMVAAGLALAYTRYSCDYESIEREAKEKSAGIWAGQFVEPWEWRKGTRLEAETVRTPAPAPARDCKIKGNISSKGKRIYHVPGSRWYNRTKIDESKGERWFCSEEEAQAAGWRAPGG